MYRREKDRFQAPKIAGELNEIVKLKLTQIPGYTFHYTIICLKQWWLCDLAT